MYDFMKICFMIWVFWFYENDELVIVNIYICELYIFYDLDFFGRFYVVFVGFNWVINYCYCFIYYGCKYKFKIYLKFFMMFLLFIK